MCVNAGSTIAIKLESVPTATALVKEVWQLSPRHWVLLPWGVQQVNIMQW